MLSQLDDVNIDQYFAGDNFNSKAEKVEVKMKFLRRKENGTDPNNLPWDWPNTADIDRIDAKWCFAGPEKPSFTDVVRGKAYKYFKTEAKVMIEIEDTKQQAVMMQLV